MVLVTVCTGVCAAIPESALAEKSGVPDLGAVRSLRISSLRRSYQQSLSDLQFSLQDSPQSGKTARRRSINQSPDRVSAVEREAPSVSLCYQLSQRTISPTPSMSTTERLQGGKAFGQLKVQQEARLEEVNQEFMNDEKYSDEEDLEEKLASFRKKYVEFDRNDQNEIDIMGLKMMMEKLGAPKTHLEVKKMISEVTGGASETINYRDFVKMMFGKRTTVLKMVMAFEGRARENGPKPAGPPPKRDIHSLP